MFRSGWKFPLAVHGLVDQLDHFLDAGVLQAFALVLERFGHMNGDILQAFVGFIGTADQQEFFTFGDAFVAILVVEADADQADQLRFFDFGFAGHELLRFVGGTQGDCIHYKSGAGSRSMQTANEFP